MLNGGVAERAWGRFHGGRAPELDKRARRCSPPVRTVTFLLIENHHVRVVSPTSIRHMSSFYNKSTKTRSEYMVGRTLALECKTVTLASMRLNLTRINGSIIIIIMRACVEFTRKHVHLQLVLATSSDLLQQS